MFFKRFSIKCRDIRIRIFTKIITLQYTILIILLILN